MGWCERELKLGAMQSSMPGGYSTAITPYVREPVESFADRDIHSLTLCWGAQTGKTLTVMAGACWYLRHVPSPGLWVMPNRDLAQAFSENRLQPLVLSSAELEAKRRKDRHKWKNLSLAFEDGILELVGSNSPANLASRPSRLLIMDETDKFADQSEKEANALELAELRTRSFIAPKIVKTSTPTLEENLIWQSYLEGDQRRYYVPCPECRKRIVLIWSKSQTALPLMGCEASMVWDQEAKREDGSWDLERVRKSVRFECPHCKFGIGDEHRPGMIARGEWRPTNPDADPGTRSYHLSSLYAPWASVAWPKTVVAWLKAVESADGVKSFVTGTLAEPDMGSSSMMVRDEQIASEDEQTDDGVMFLTADYQMKRPYFWFVVRTWRENGESALVEHGHVDSWEELVEVQRKHQIPDVRVAVDSRWRPSEVFGECLRHGKIHGSRMGGSFWRGWRSVMGHARRKFYHAKSKSWRAFELKPAAKDLLDGKLPKRTTLNVLHVSSCDFKDILAHLRQGDSWRVSKRAASDRDYWRHLDSEKLVISGSATAWRLPNKRVPNHLLDCEMMQVALATMARFLSGPTKTKGPEKDEPKAAEREGTGG